MTREAVEADIPALLALYKQSHAASIHRDVPFSENDSADLTRRLMASDAALVAVTDDVSAVLIVVLSPLHFNASVLEAYELSFWGKGGRALVEYATQWAKAKGARRLVLNNEKTERHEAMGRWYQRAGFQSAGVAFERVV